MTAVHVGNQGGEFNNFLYRESIKFVVEILQIAFRNHLRSFYILHSVRQGRGGRLTGLALLVTDVHLQYKRRMLSCATGTRASGLRGI